MISAGLFACFTAAFVFLFLLINLATLALPVWVAGFVFLLVQKAGEGLIASGLIGLSAGAIVHFFGILACKTVSSRSVAILIASFYAAPAGMAGYYLGLGMGRLVFVAAVFQQISAIVFGVLIFIHSWKRLAPLDFSVVGYGEEETKSR